jgi:TrmH family RNA methyltransferase
MLITSKQNPRIKSLVSLRQRRERQLAGVTLVDGYEELLCALAAGITIRSLYYCQELMGGEDQLTKLQDLISSGVEVHELTREVFEKAAYREGPDGWLAVVPSVATEIDKLPVKPNALILVCEAVEKPGNLGAMLRTADAAGVDAVIAVDSVTDWSNPNIVRASKGAVFTVPVADASRDELLAWLSKHRVTAIASTPDTTTEFTAVDMTGPVALLVGAEKPGLSAFWLSRSDIKVRIPMAGKVNSLNVATSAALLLYEAVRQRSSQRPG